MPITIRQASYGDAQLLAGIRVRLIAEDSGPLPVQEREELHNRCLTFITDALHDGSFFAFLAFDAAQVVGTCGCCVYSVLPGRKLPSGMNAYIQNVYVDPSCRRQGIATKLLDKTIEKAKEAGCGRITLHATQQGRQLFRSCGFSDETDLGLTMMVLTQP